MNELGREKSPYLLQHKDNPVWWRAWSEKAFKAARDRNQPIFLSIGYATCHWCHVMEHESFEDVHVAKILNDNFISIKVDREELPDVDQIYMDAIHAMGQRGGWPLNLILTPDLQPLYGGTYFPKPHLIKLLMQLSDMWKDDHEKMLASAEQVFQFLNQQSRQYTAQQAMDPKIFESSVQNFKSTFDPDHGGFGGAPKFPPHSQLQWIARLYVKTQDSELLLIFEKTLKEMAKGGLYDHIGGGFTRYSVDERWEIPHFEKMLYVNSQCAINYFEAYQLTENPEYLRVGTDTLEYVLRDMLSSGSGFYSAEDADSLNEHGEKKEEGAFYVWTFAELTALLTSEELAYAQKYLGVTSEGNFEHRFNHFHLTQSQFWEARGNPLFKSLQKKLFEVREKRERPLLDDKQLTSWNALMISAMATGFRVTQDKRYLQAALQSAGFIKSTLYEEPTLYRRYRDGEKKYFGTLDDYAFLIKALIDLYQSTFEESWLLWAYELQETQNTLFWDTTSAGYYYTQANTKNLIVRTKDFADNAIPNSNAISVWNLLALSHYFSNVEYRQKAEASFSVVGDALGRFPSAFSTLLIAYDFFTNEKSQQLVFPKQNANIQELVRRKFLPCLILASGKSSEIPLLQNKSEDKFYLCQNGSCELPESDDKKIVVSLTDK